MALVLLVAMTGTVLAAADPDTATETTEVAKGVTSQATFVFIWAVALVCAIIALIFAVKFFKMMKAADEGNEEMVEIAGHVRVGANAYLWQQYKVVGLFFVVICGLLAWMAFGLQVQSKWVPFAFLTGGFFSGLAGWFGMKTATWASNRTAAGAQKSLNQGLQVAFRSGAVMGLTVVGLGLLDITLWFGFLYWIWPMFGHGDMTLVEITVTMLCFGMGASSQALFARVGGGIFTKAADVGADLVGKVEAGIPEDDKRNPATIADNVGDNVGDVAGMGADLYESYCGSILATAALGVAAFASGELISKLDAYKGIEVTKEMIQSFQLRALFLPMAMAGVGILLSILGIFVVKTDEKADQKTLLKALARGVNLSSLFVIVAAFGLAYWLLHDFWQVAFSVVVGLVAGWLIGKWTEYCTSDEFKPTKKLADQALTGPATIIIGGIADGMMSVWFPVVIVSIATLLSFGFASNWNFNDIHYFAMGLYGVGIAAVGMLSTLGITLATDAYGPIADNAGGNAEMAGLDPIVRERTDALDSLGNTTAATGKGFAIGSAALTALALLAAYVEEVRMGHVHWGESAIEEVASVEDTPYVKFNDQFIGEKVVVKDKDGNVVKDKDGKEKEEFVGYMLMPSHLREMKGDFANEWEKLDTKNGPVAIKSELITATEDGPVIKATNDKLTAVQSANMIDWMTYYSCNLMNPKVLVGVFLGAMATFVFCAMTMKAVGRAAFGMVEEVRRQFREKPGIMDYTEKPDYATPVAISTKAAQKEMIIPSIIGLLIPVVTGMLLGVAGVIGLLVGGLTCGFCVAIFMANAGGSWDNAKKYIEAGAHGGKGTEAHKAAVVGDTVGDPFKDTSGPSLNILIKLMSMVSVVVAGLIVRYSLTALGIF
jgi:inorganic pyrophosphatase/K(+)-stimulated pyrophosphate-energized sodium pump